MATASVDSQAWSIGDVKEVLDVVLEVLGDSHHPELIAISPPLDPDGMPHAFIRVRTEQELRLLRREVVSGQWCYFSLDAPSDTSFSFHIRGIHLMAVAES